MSQIESQNGIDDVGQRSRKETLSILLGAAFLMATSSIGPGFLTQTAVFTNQLKASFAFAILISIIINLIVQLNVWRILAVSKMRAQDVANKVFPGLGYFIAFLVALGGLVFNIGNVAGASMGLNVIAGIPIAWGAVISASIGIMLFLYREMGRAMDQFTKILGFIMIALVLYTVFVTKPPVGVAVKEAFMPSQIDWMVIITLIGGTVGGYITFSGAHRLLDAGICGVEHIKDVTRGATNGIVITGIMRILLFLAILGVVWAGHTLDPQNPPASAFRLGAGEIGYRIFGVVLWAAGITSVVGASFTSISFLQTLFKGIQKNNRWWIIGFIVTSTVVLITVGQPVTLLIFAGSVNGLILPLALLSVMLAAHRKDIVGEYRHPKWLTVTGYLMVAITLWMGVISLGRIFTMFG
ncbi:NRAMP family divalent metal transporter [Acetomicrobium hydrogeniformans]|uniref:Transporter, branched chain amino acid:cation symporter family protein n=1 Tax=Acetomicrobium hydrogeniformans ATCC BAA-1850 TaxID=592015 RepID=A0A0T5X9F4_9BACT|nr:transporter, branched chain amino acid:cation symporter family protein [Acetomicrobium hydrogeniformans ATCC BAA-1850]